jgi:KDO2-lipid IV(A) lauroyltransferase
MKDLKVKIVRGILVLLSKFPLKFHYFMGDVFSWLAMNVIRYRYDVVVTNVSRAFPEKRTWEVRRIVRDFYMHFGELVAETIWFSGSSYDRLRKNRIMTLTNPEVVSEYYSRFPSITLLSTHCGNWELTGGLLGCEDHDGERISVSEKAISVVYKKMTSEVADRVFALNRVAPLELVGTECEVESRNILRYSIRHKDEKRIYIYPADQAPYKGAGRHPIGKFMSQDTTAMIGSAGVACKLSHAVIYMKMKRVDRGQYEISFIPICENASEFTPEEIIRKYYDLLEQEIRETPCNWLWSHNRWKW